MHTDNFLTVNELLILFKGQHVLKTYNSQITKKWGYKAFVLCDVKGVTYNFFIYSGAIDPVCGLTDCGASGNIVLKLTECVPRNMDYRLFYDNYLDRILLK